MKVMIVEDEPLVAASFATLIEVGGRHSVVGIAHDSDTARYIAQVARPDLAFIDVKLANNTTGYEVASSLNARGIVCVFATATPPPFAMPEIAVGCLTKPLRSEEVSTLLDAVETMLREGRAA